MSRGARERTRSNSPQIMATFKNEVSKNAIVTSQSKRLGKVFTRVKCFIQPEFILVSVHEVTKREYHYYPPPLPLDGMLVHHKLKVIIFLHPFIKNKIIKSMKV